MSLWSHSPPTAIDAYHALLSKHLDLSDDSEYDYDSDADGEEGGSHAAESSTPIPQWTHQQQQRPGQQRQEEEEDGAGWQAVGVKGKAVPQAVPPAGGTAGGSTGARDEAEELRRREEELLAAALQVTGNREGWEGGFVAGFWSRDPIQCGGYARLLSQ